MDIACARRPAKFPTPTARHLAPTRRVTRPKAPRPVNARLCKLTGAPRRQLVGDSGAPLLIKQGGRWYTAGVDVTAQLGVASGFAVVLDEARKRF